MTVTVAADKLGDAIPPSSDAEVIDGVKNGAFEMAVVPARAWSDAGVTSFRALQAPFLIESDEQAAAIVSDDGIASPMLSGLEGTGVTGLVLYPEGLRHLFGFGTPILTPADVAGRQIRPSRQATRTRSSGRWAARPSRGGLRRNGERIRDGTIRGLESSFALMSEEPGCPSRPATWSRMPRWALSVASDEFWASLSDAQQTIVQDAANATRAWAIANLVKDADAAASYCETGGTVVLADPEAVDQFRAAASDVITELAKDATTDGLDDEDASRRDRASRRSRWRHARRRSP